MVLLEVCIDSAAGLRAAVDGGAGRLEVCSRLDLDGLTPTDELLVEAVRSGIPCVAMIRRSAGDHFIGGRANTPGMLGDLVRAKKLGAQGFALGALMRNGSVADSHVRAYVELAAPWPVTFHRAFDWTRDRFEALDLLAEIGVKRVLSSGGAANAFEGKQVLRELVEHARGRITVVAAGGVRASNAREIVEVSGVSEIHSSTVFSVTDLS